jgi:hypothetical protein
LRASGAGDKFRDALNRGSKAWKENTALTKEAELRYKTAQSRLIMFKNRIDQLAESFGKILVQAIVPFLESLTPLINFFQNLSPTVKVIIVVFGALVAAIGPLLIAFGFLTSAVGAIMSIMTPAVLTIGLIASGIGAIMFALVGLSALIAVVITRWKELTYVWQDWSKFVVKMTEVLVQFGKDLFETLVSPIDFVMDKITELAVLLSGGGILSKIAAGLGFKVDGAPGEVGATGAQGLIGDSVNKSQSEVKIKVEAAEGSSATVEGVKTKGDTEVSVASIGYIGDLGVI